MGDRLDAIDAALSAIDPTWIPLSESDKEGIREAFADAGPLAEEQRETVARILRRNARRRPAA